MVCPIARGAVKRRLLAKQLARPAPVLGTAARARSSTNWLRFDYPPASVPASAAGTAGAKLPVKPPVSE